MSIYRDELIEEKKWKKIENFFGNRVIIDRIIRRSIIEFFLERIRREADKKENSIQNKTKEYAYEALKWEKSEK